MKNCIVICCDTFRYDALANPDVKTPNLDSLVKRGVSYTQAFAEGLPTIQARRSMFTGRRCFPWKYEEKSRGLYPVIPGWHRIPAEHDTFSEIMLEAEYTTGFVADTYHMFKPTQNFHRGFCSWSFIRGQEGDPVRSGPLSAIDVSPYRPDGKNDLAGSGSFTQYQLNMLDREKEEDYLPARVFRRGAEWLDENIDNSPFFLWIDSFAPHEYWDPPREFADIYYKAKNSKDYIVPQWLNTKEDRTEDEIERTKALYLGYVTFVDKWIGHFFDKMNQNNLWDNTIVVFTSDHGTELWDKGRFGKGGDRLYHYNSQVPLVIANPDNPGGGENEDMIQHIDIMPTLLDQLGINAPEGIDGKSGGGDDKIVVGWHQWCSVRSKKWNVIFDSTGENDKKEVFNLIEDPKETTDVYDNHPAIAQEYISFAEEKFGQKIPFPIMHEGDRRQVPPFSRQWSQIK